MLRSPETGRGEAPAHLSRACPSREGRERSSAFSVDRSDSSLKIEIRKKERAPLDRFAPELALRSPSESLDEAERVHLGCQRAYDWGTFRGSAGSQGITPGLGVSESSEKRDNPGSRAAQAPRFDRVGSRPRLSPAHDGASPPGVAWREMDGTRNQLLNLG